MRTIAKHQDLLSQIRAKRGLWHPFCYVSRPHGSTPPWQVPVSRLARMLAPFFLTKHCLYRKDRLDYSLVYSMQRWAKRTARGDYFCQYGLSFFCISWLQLRIRRPEQERLSGFTCYYFLRNFPTQSLYVLCLHGSMCKQSSSSMMHNS